MKAARLATIGFMAAMATGAWAESPIVGPAEAPPADFTGREFVDSAGCVFQRAGVSGATVWLPRQTKDGALVCGLTPSIGGIIAEERPADVPKPEVDLVDSHATANVGDPAMVKSASRTPAVAKAAPVKLVSVRTVSRSETLCPKGSRTAQRYELSDGLRVTKCGPAVEDAVAFINSLGLPNLHVSGVVAPGEVESFSDASKYRIMWSNAAVATDTDSGMSADDIGSKRWIQVGAFSQPANAGAALDAVKALGLPAAHQKLPGPKKLEAVLAGPFAKGADMTAAMAQLRQAGFSEAFYRQ